MAITFHEFPAHNQTRFNLQGLKQRRLQEDAMFGHAEGGVPEGWPPKPDWSTGPFIPVKDEGFLVT